MFRLNRRRALIGAAVILLALVLGGVAVVLIDRPEPDAERAPGGVLALSLAGDPLNRLSLPDGAIEPVPLRAADGTLSNAWWVTRARDGSRIAFLSTADRVTRVYVANPDGTGARPVSSGPRDSQPAIAPDGSQVVFVRSRDFFSALFITDAETGEERQLTEYTNDLEPDWSPDGTRIVFTTSRDGFQELYTMAPDGTDVRRLTENEGLNDLRARFSPDGSQIAYMTNYAVNDGSGEIWVMDADGSNQRRLTDNTLDDGPPVWSPDGRYLAFSAGTLPPDIRRALYVYDLETDRLARLTPDDGSAYFPLWSPDSAWIAFITRHDDNTRSIDVIRRDGSGARTVLERSGELFFWLWLP